MLRRLLLGLALPALQLLQAQGLSEGPHVIWQGSEARILSVEAGKLQESRRKGPFTLPLPGLCAEPLTLSPEPPAPPEALLPDPGRIAAVSDIHGDFGRLEALLQGQGIIGPRLEWRFGTGVLVVVGDVVDRGPQVTECLWFLRGLEAQARRAGGRLLPLLGNHETMVMKGDWRYVNPRYRQLPEGSPDPGRMLGPDTELGRWVRSWPLMARVGPFLFTHGGLSAEFLERGLDLNRTNGAVRRFLLQQEESPEAAFLFGSRGPLWYRGLVPGATPFTAGEEQVTALLKAFGARALVIGHTTQSRIEALHGGRVFAIDAGINEGRPGELWIWDRNGLWRGHPDGNREALEAR